LNKINKYHDQIEYKILTLTRDTSTKSWDWPWHV